jgi:protein MpaA
MGKLAAAVAAVLVLAIASAGGWSDGGSTGPSAEIARQAGKPLGQPRSSDTSQRRVGLGSIRGMRRETILVGRSALGRPLRVTAFGNSDAPRKVMVIGCIHGTECAGMAIVRRLGGCPPPGVDLWLVENLNPDGSDRGTRVNGRGVDLNRNFPSGWRAIGRRWDPEHSGPHPLSEPEARVARRLVRVVRPAVTIWFHQQAQPLVRAWGGSVPEARRFARLAGLPFHRLPWLAGTAPNWQNHRFPGTSSFVVELPLGPVGIRDSVRYAAAIERLGGYRGENQIARAHPRKPRARRPLKVARRP